MSDAPVRVLYVLGGLNRGGAETWTVQLLEHVDRRRIQIDIWVHRREGAYEERVQALGVHVHSGGDPRHLLSYMARLKRFLCEQGPYQVVHSHLNFFDGLVMQIAYQAGVPGRIAHARNVDDGKGSMGMRFFYRALMRYWISRYATHLFAVSEVAAEGIWGKRIARNHRHRIMTGLDFSPFQIIVDRERVRADLNIPNNALVIGHVGSFRRQKNHEFILRIAPEILHQEPNVIFLFIGNGSLRSLIEEKVCTLGMRKHFYFLGERNDIPRLLSAMDAFVFPSLYEGLPRALLEAQAAGLPCVASRNITPEVAASPESVSFLGLQEDPQVWARILLEKACESISPARGAEAIRCFDARGMTISANAKELTQLYEEIARANYRAII